MEPLTLLVLVVAVAPLWAAFLFNAGCRRYHRRKRQRWVGQKSARWQLGDFLTFYPNWPGQRERDDEYLRLKKEKDALARYGVKPPEGLEVCGAPFTR